MATKSLNSVGGFSVTDLSGNVVIIIDDNGNVSTPDLTVTGISDLGSISNVRITGGSSGQSIITDGAGNLSFGGATGNVYITSPMPFYINIGETYYVTANHQGLFSVPITIDGALQIDGILVEV